MSEVESEFLGEYKKAVPTIDAVDEFYGDDDVFDNDDKNGGLNSGVDKKGGFATFKKQWKFAHQFMDFLDHNTAHDELLEEGSISTEHDEGEKTKWELLRNVVLPKKYYEGKNI